MADGARVPESAEHWAHVRALIEKTASLPLAARREFLEVSCDGDDALRQRVERLTRDYERTDGDWGFLGQPAGGLVAPLLVAALSPETDELLPRVSAALADRYHIERELGVGGMATVYLATDIRHQRQVAIKVLLPRLTAAIGIDRFLSEIRTTAALQHPHILPLFDSGSAGGLLFYVMPLVEGETLRSRLTREKQLPVEDALQIARDVGGALDYAHRRGVIHRDIKPENILLHEGRPVVADFGIALAVQSAGNLRLTQPGMSLGTPQYMSPEQTTGELDLTARSDIYALAAVIYEMLIGEPPFTGATAQQVAARVRAEEPRSITAQRKHVPLHVDAAVLKALEKLPADRFETAGEFVRALSDPAFAERVSRRRLWPRQQRRQQGLLVGVLGAAALTLALLAAWGWLRTPDEASEVVRFTMPLPPDVSIVSTAATGDMAVSPDGHVVVFSGSAADGTRRLYARSLDEVVPRELAGTEGAAEPFFSPDGDWIAFWSGDRGLKKVAAMGGVPQTVTTMLGAGGTWTVNDIIVFGSDMGLYFVQSSGGTPTPVLTADTVRALYPMALPDGDHVLFSTMGREGVSIGIASLSARSAQSVGIAGINVLGFIDDYVVYATRDNSLMAVPFDASTGRTRGAAVPVATDVRVGVVGAAKAALSLSGTLAYRRGDRGSRLMLTNGSDATDAVLTAPHAYAFPRFSPDGRRIAITIESGTRSDVWIHNLESGTRTRVSSGGSSNERPEWTPDGSRVLYRTDEGAGSSIWWRAADLSSPPGPLVQETTPRGFFYEGVITPNGRSIVYQRNNDVEMRALTGDTTTSMVAVSGAEENQARVSPDGRWVAFVTDESGSDQVVVQPLVGPGRRVQVSLTGGTEPVWSGNSRLFYRANRKFMVATVVSKPEFEVASRSVFGNDRFVPAASPHANYDVTPDGKRLLVLEAVEDAPILVVHHWATEVRARLKGNPR